MDDFGIKELYSVTLKTTSDMEINGVQYQEREPIISFDRIQIANLNENKRRVSARGGYGNQTFITWENTDSVTFSFNEGIISKQGLSIISNSKILTPKMDGILIPYSEIIESEISENQRYLTTKFPIKKDLFIKINGEKVTDYTLQSNQKIILNDDRIAGESYVVYYDYIYEDDSQIFVVGERAIPNFVSLTARARVKDGQTGKESTAILEIPKLKLVSDLTMRMGNKITPYVYGFQMIGYPVGPRTKQHVCRWTFLDSDIDADF